MRFESAFTGAATPEDRSGLRSVVRSVVIGLVVVAVLLVTDVPASADAGDVKPSDCLSGEAGPRDLVAESGFGWFRTISLYCGDQTKGILHIELDHPISDGGEDDENIVLCMDAILTYGDEVEAEDGNEAYSANRSDGGDATLVWDSNTDEVISMFTSDNNNWAACAEGVNG